MAYVACIDGGAWRRRPFQIRLTAIAYNLKRALNIITAAAA